MRRVEPAPGWALATLTCSPAAFPARALVTDEVVAAVVSFSFTEATEPVRSRFFMEP